VLRDVAGRAARTAVTFGRLGPRKEAVGGNIVPDPTFAPQETNWNEAPARRALGFRPSCVRRREPTLGHPSGRSTETMRPAVPTLRAIAIPPNCF